MAPLKLHYDKAEELDAEIWRIYGHRLGGDELSQLAKLFRNAALLTVLHELISAELPRSSSRYREEVEIKVAWIDKRPLAKLKKFANRVELGDAAVFYFDQVKTRQRTFYPQARALILQAKVAKERGQISCPTVPVNPSNPSANSTTMRELALLSNWGRFDLYKASGSHTAIAKGIEVKFSDKPPPHGWYIATPKIQPTAQDSATWTSPWMGAPAIGGRPCDVSFGRLLWSFLTCSVPSASLPEVGADFDFKPSSILHPHGNDWSRLCSEMLRLCPNNQLPPSLFGANVPAMNSTVMRSLPYLGSGDASWATWLRRLMFPPKMPVLFVVLTRLEG